jgi:PAS domain S-box-containing protein
MRAGFSSRSDGSPSAPDFSENTPQTLKKCRQSDKHIKQNLHKKGYIPYKCKNGLNDTACPVIIDGNHLGTIFFGQFFYLGEKVNKQEFLKKAEKYGFDLAEFERAFDEIPVYSQDQVQNIMDFYAELSEFITNLAYDRYWKIQVEKARRKKADRELMRSKSFLNAIVDHLPMGLQIFDANGVSRRMNRKQAELLGLPSTETGKFNVLTDDISDNEALRQAYREVYEQKKVVEREYEYDFSIRRNKWEISQGKKFFCEIIFPILDPSGKLSAVGSLLSDITARKEAEKALQESETRYRSVIHAVNEGIILEDLNGIIIACNQAAEKILNISENSLIGMNIKTAPWKVIRENRTPVAFEDFPSTVARKTGKPQKKIVLGLYHSDGSLTWISLTSEPISQEGRREHTAVVSSFMDITQLKRKEEELQKANRTKDKLFSIVGHDLKNSFTTIRGFSDLLRRFTPPDEPTQHYISQINEAAGETLVLLDNLLNWARSQMGNMMHAFNELCLNEVSNQILSLYKTPIHRKEIRIVNEIPEDIVVKADQDMIHTILRNLISNAVKFTENGVIFLSAEKNHSEVKIKIRDTGVGMSEEDIHNLLHFSEYRSQSGTHGEQGTGVGLMLCRELIQMHGGTLEIESSPDEGSVFSFTLPC